jgi:hypothetical protein
MGHARSDFATLLPTDAIRRSTQDALQQLLGGIAPQPSHATEDEFRQWYRQMAAQHGLAEDPDDPSQFYDYRAAHQANARPDASGHWPSDFKKPGHPNMVVGGFHVQTGERVPGTPQASEAELIRLGWDTNFARKVSRR